MEVIISSQYLAKQLSSINFENNRIYLVHSNQQNQLTLVAHGINVNLEVETNQYNSFSQEQNNWKHIYELVNKISDQPIVLKIDENILEAKLKY